MLLSRKLIARWIAITAFVFVFVGCGEDHGKKQSVKGAVKLKGQALDQGRILFTPKGGGSGSMGGAEIKDGQYELSGAAGINPGTYEVRVTSPETQAAVEEAPGVAGPPAKDRIPPDYNVQTKLEFEVKEGQANEFNVEIP